MIESATTVDIQRHIADLMLGRDGLMPFGRPCILRQIRRDSDGAPVKCTCYDNVSGDKGVNGCPYCHGEGWLFDDQLILALIVASRFFGATSGELENFVAGAINPEETALVILPTVAPTDIDKVIELNIPAGTQGPYPVDVRNAWDIEASTPVYGANGEIIYYWVTVAAQNRG